MTHSKKCCILVMSGKIQEPFNGEDMMWRKAFDSTLLMGLFKLILPIYGGFTPRKHRKGIA